MESGAMAIRVRRGRKWGRGWDLKPGSVTRPIKLISVRDREPHGKVAEKNLASEARRGRGRSNQTSS